MTQKIYPRLKMAIGPAIKVAQTVYKYRKYIYRTLVAQDRAIDKAFKIGGYGRQTRYGVRHGIAAGSVVGTLITQGATPGNDVVSPPKPRSSIQTDSTSKTRNRRTRRSGSRRYCYDSPRGYSR